MKSILAILMCALASAVSAQAPADLVLRGGRVVTVDAAKPEAEAIAVVGSRIAAVGTNAEIARWVGPKTQVIELNGRLVIPGLIEGHGHYMGLGQQKLGLELMQVKNFDEIAALVGKAAAGTPKDAWIIGRGWHQEKWDRVPQPNVEGVPLHAALDAVSPNNPVVLTHASGHASFVNGRALELANITRNTPNPEGGEIVKDARGEPTGLLRETAQGLVSGAMARAQAARSAAEREAESRRIVQLAAEDALSKGITSFVDAGVGFSTIDFYRKMEAEHALPVRLYVMVRASSNEMAQKLERYRMAADTNDYLVMRSIKRSMDGALGSHGAWLLEPYTDMPESTGLATDDTADVRKVAELAVKYGYQFGIHAIGDRANREVLNIYESVLKAHPEAKDLRWRIEHAQHLHPSEVKRFAPLGIIAAMQGVHATSDGPWIPKRLGDARAKSGAYVWRDLMNAGVLIANGTDVPVEDIDPIASYYSSVSRRMNNGQVFYGEQRMTREEALRTYTINNAIATYEENTKGSLTPGKLADITVLSKDILKVPEEEIPTARADITIVGGQVKYRRSPGVAGR